MLRAACTAENGEGSGWGKGNEKGFSGYFWSVAHCKCIWRRGTLGMYVIEESESLLKVVWNKRIWRTVTYFIDNDGGRQCRKDVWRAGRSKTNTFSQEFEEETETEKEPTGTGNESVTTWIWRCRELERPQMDKTIILMIDRPWRGLHHHPHGRLKISSLTQNGHQLFRSTPFDWWSRCYWDRKLRKLPGRPRRRSGKSSWMR